MLDSNATLLGLDNVRLDLPLAGIGSRTLAALIDYMLLIVLLGMWWTAGLLTLAVAPLPSGWWMSLLVLGSFFLQWGYFAALEILMQGQTPGKQLVGLRVVTRHGGRPGAGSLLMRNLLRAVDVVYGLPVMAFDARSRRLGDMAAATLVIHDRPPEAGTEWVLGEIPPGWGGREVAVVESFLGRATLMEPERVRMLAEKLLAWIERREGEFVAQAGFGEGLEPRPPGAEPVDLLRRLLAARLAGSA